MLLKITIMDGTFPMTSEDDLDVTNRLESVAKNLALFLLPSSLWGIHIDPNFEYIAILHVEVINYCKVTVDRGIVLTYDHTYQCLNTSVFINNEAVSLPIFQYTVRTLSDLTHMVYTIHQLVLCKNSDSKHPNCMKYLKTDEFEKLCTNCRLNEQYFYGVEINNEHGNESMETNSTEGAAVSNESISKDDAPCKINRESFRYQDEGEDQKDLASDGSLGDELKCDICNKEFKTKKYLRNHKKTHVQEKYVCSICNMVNTHRSSHYKHVATHSNDNTILCSICGKTFCKGYGLENHLLTHSQEKPYECKICFKIYSSKKNLRIHGEMHKGNRPYACKICNKTFTTPSNLSTHVKSLHNKKKPHPCVMCGMSFLYPQLLKIHMRKHTGEKPYQCTVCGKTFALNVHLTIHTRTHTGEKPFICSICGKGFTTTGNLTSHKKVHTKENG